MSGALDWQRELSKACAATCWDAAVAAVGVRAGAEQLCCAEECEFWVLNSDTGTWDLSVSLCRYLGGCLQRFWTNCTFLLVHPAGVYLGYTPFVAAAAAGCKVDVASGVGCGGSCDGGMMGRICCVFSVCLAAEVSACEACVPIVHAHQADEGSSARGRRAS